MRLQPVEQTIITTVHTMQRDYTKVLPWMVQSRLPVNVSERQVRRYMSNLASEGYLRRRGQRCGYEAIPRRPVEFHFQVRPLQLSTTLH